MALAQHNRHRYTYLNSQSPEELAAMAYVRIKGNQLAIVHGIRDSETRKVDQKTLFTLYSKTEARAATGKQHHHFQRILETDSPSIRFDWKKIDAGIEANLEHLPDVYGYKKAQVQEGFRDSMTRFARELILADPQNLISSARLIQANRHELLYLRKLIDWRLKLCEQDETEWNTDNPFYWRTRSQRREVPPDQWEELSDLYNGGQYDEAEAVAQLLISAWPNFARGHNYLGLIAIERREFEEAASHFDDAMRVGRKLFPKRIRKDMWWSDTDTRPYIRAIIYKADALNQLGDYAGALRLCDRLETECHRDIDAQHERASILLNCARWAEAAESARYVSSLYPTIRLPLAFAYAEMGDFDRALVTFLHGLVQHPRLGRMLLLATVDTPTEHNDIRDHNTAIAMRRDMHAYLAEMMADEVADFFEDVLEAPSTLKMIEDYRVADANWRAERGTDRTWFKKRGAMESEAAAQAIAKQVAAELGE